MKGVNQAFHILYHVNVVGGGAGGVLGVIRVVVRGGNGFVVV